MEATSSGEVMLPSECTPATLSFKGKIVSLYVEEMSTTATILISETLSGLMRDFSHSHGYYMWEEGETYCHPKFRGEGQHIEPENLPCQDHHLWDSQQ
jgi:hypothetical protein